MCVCTLASISSFLSFGRYLKMFFSNFVAVFANLMEISPSGGIRRVDIKAWPSSFYLDVPSGNLR